MSPDPSKTPLTPPPRTFSDDEFGPVSPLPPNYADKLASAHAELTATASDASDAIGAHVAAAESELSSAQTEAYSAIASVLGQIDGELRTATTTVNSAIQKATEQAFSALVYAEEDLRGNGVHIVDTPEQRVIDMDDPTGQATIDRLIGLPPGGSLTTTGGENVLLQPGQGVNTALGPALFGPGAIEPLGTPNVLGLPPTVPPTVTQPPPIGEPPTPCNCPVAPPTGPTCPAPIINVTCPTPVVNETINLPPPLVTIEPIPEGPPPEPPPPPPPPPPDDSGGGGGGAGGGGAPGPDVREIPAPLPYMAPAGVCAQLGDILAYYHTRGGAEATGGGSYQSAVSQIYRGAVTVFKTYSDFVFSGFNDEVKAEALKANTRLTGDILGGYSSLTQVIDEIVPRYPLDKSAAWNLGLVLAQASKAERDTGFPVGYLTTPLLYAYQYANPVQIPSQAELNGLFANGKLDYPQWICYTRAQGNLPELQTLVVDTGATKPNVSEIIDLYRRGVITDWVDVIPRLREQGVMNPRHYEEFRALSEFVPGASDLVRFMERDAFDPAVVKAYGYDTEFELKFYGPGGKVAPGPAAAWAKSQGISEDQMRAYWYSHWQIPSNTALYEMAHRLRPDRPDVDAYARAKIDDPAGVAAGKYGAEPTVVTVPDIQRAIEVNDMAPGWVKPLIEVSYHPINRTDAIDAYFNGAFSETDLYHAMRDNGYDHANANRLVDIQKAKRGGRLANQSGIWTQRQIFKAYIDGAITSMKADQLLTPLVTDPGVRQQLIAAADAKFAAEVTSARIDRVKRGFYVGMYDILGAEAELSNLGIDPNHRAGMVRKWDALRQGRLREPTAKMVMDWMKGGVLSLADGQQRLHNLGYMDSDISRMIALISKNQTEAALKAKKLDQAAAQKAIKDAAAAKRQESKDLEARQKAIIKYMKDYEKELKNINAELAARPPGATGGFRTIPPESEGLA